MSQPWTDLPDEIKAITSVPADATRECGPVARIVKLVLLERGHRVPSDVHYTDRDGQLVYYITIAGETIPMVPLATGLDMDQDALEREIRRALRATIDRAGGRSAQRRWKDRRR